MNGNVVRLSCVRNPQCLTYSKHKIFALNQSAVQTETVSDLSSTRCWPYFPFCMQACVDEKQQGVASEKKSLLNERRV